MTALEKAKTTYDFMVREYGATNAHAATARDRYIKMMRSAETQTVSDEEAMTLADKAQAIALDSRDVGNGLTA
jgi:hypothetical protein